MVPKKFKRWAGFSADEPRESSAYNQTEHPNALPASWHCSGLQAFEATAADVVSLVLLANGADAATVGASRFHATLQKQDAALLPKQKPAVAALATVKLLTIVEMDSDLGDFATLSSAINFPSFETQPAYLADLTARGRNEI
jgi:hypothetical protein